MKNSNKLSDEAQNGNLDKPMLAEVISRDQYLNAVELIDNYHRQNSNVVLKTTPKSMFSLKKGDFVECKRIQPAVFKKSKCEVSEKFFPNSSFSIDFRYPSKSPSSIKLIL